MGHPAELQALDYPPYQPAMGHPAELQALDNPPISQQSENTR
jgi:hypothetical protein